MRKPVSTDQSHQLMSTLSTNVDWSALDADIIQGIIKNPTRAGEEFTAFLRNSGRLTVDPKILRIDYVHPFDPAEFIGKGWTVDEQDKQSLLITELDLSKIQFRTCLKEGGMKGEEKLERLKTMNVIRHGGNEFLALWNNYEANGENSGLEWLRKNRGITYLDFFGLILRSLHSNRYVLCLVWNNYRWRWDYLRLTSKWYDLSFSAVSAK